MKRIALLALLLAASAVVKPAAGGETEVRVEEIPRGWVTRLAYPLRLTVANGGGGELRTLVRTRGWNITRNAGLPGGASAVFETTVFGQRGGSVSWSYGGMGDEERFTHANVGWNYVEGRNPALTCVDSYLFRELEGIEGGGEETAPLVLQLGREQLPRRWQSYVGMVSNLLMEPRAVESLDREQREALSRWVLWLGGSLWLAGKGAGDALRTLELELPEAPDERIGEIERYRLFNGWVSLLAEPDAAAIAAHPAPERRVDPFVAYYPNREFLASTEWMHDSLGGVSVGFIIGSLLVLAVILGPATYLYVRRRKSMLLFYLITPIVACVGSAGIIVGSALVEGFGVRYNQCAVLVRRDGSNDAMMFDLRGVRAGYAIPTLRFPAESIVLPVDEPSPANAYAVDLTDGVALTGGWLKPRFPTGYLAATPVVSRMNVEVRREGDRAYAVNGLGFTLESVVARMPDGRYGWAANVPPGERAPLRIENDDYRLRQLRNEYERVSGERAAFSNVILAARAAGLPYQDDGGLDGRLVRGDFYYLVAGGNGGGAK